jgi:hypothetical protein
MIRSLAFLFTCSLFAGTLSAQGWAVNGTGAAADNSAIIDVSSTSSGVLIPRMTAIQVSAIASPATGLLVYQTDATSGFYYYNGSVWKLLNVPAALTTQGNTFNGANQLVQLNGSAQLPAVSGANLTNLSAANLTGTVAAINGANLTNLNGANITNTSMPVDKISTSGGTASASTYLRGDGTWATPSGGGGGFQLQLRTTHAGGQIISTVPAEATVDWSTPTVNVGGQFNAGTDQFTAANAGNYLVSASLDFSTSGRLISIVVNGSIRVVGAYNSNQLVTSTSGYASAPSSVFALVSLNAGDVLKINIATPFAQTTVAGNSSFVIEKL